ncbi:MULTISPECIES: hypothetical protein [Pseudomonas syringae group]|uniref:Uncharacterized protein n=1 Tax=Pseudomonas syringae pv. primulae TaxID=251707 RepID=A0A3M3Y509_9PSED|nr:MULTISPECIES: hypothetical protein [Pseudomonas syringae group]EGH98981.1 hypothetical protein PLA106_23048 [Pseudomonas amygdali pv. lachrymans str. M302278]KPX76765.1 Uncharacterized protein ALO84_02449 [Pseudomonas syringae pv. maculicola]PYD04379.1 hypothetical protein DND90_08770 [Pseudomonas syringae pv. maculicola]QQN28279.1 hypothetical protein JHZ65_04585 [Pseudomonas syringae pv. maculicola]RMM13191.1 hypothetical protein ALQ85_102746 [Pseudomonas syringae]
MRKAVSSFLLPTFFLSFVGTAQAASVAEVFTGEMLGKNQRYFESIAGIPRESNGNNHEFMVQGCNITASIDAGKVTSLRLEVTPKCQADLNSFISTYAPAPGKPLTIGSFDDSSGGGLRYSADCLTMCGNSHDPSVYALWEGPHAVNWMQVLLEVTLSSDEAIAASDTWRSEIQKAKGEDFVVDTAFNCKPEFEASAKKAFEKVAVTAVTIGTGLVSPGCAQ